MLKRSNLLILLSFLLLLIATRSFAAAQEVENPPAVQAILFYSPTCPHCHKVITEFLIPMQETYGDQLQILGVDTSDPAGQVLYGMAIEHFQIPENRRGVPALIVRDIVLVGAVEIPDQFPGIVEEGLLAGGIGWPNIPDLTLIVPDLPPSADPAAQAEAAAEIETSEAAEAVSIATAVPANAANNETESLEPTAVEAARPAASSARSLEEASRDTSSAEAAPVPPADPLGFTLAWFVLIGMIAAVIYALRQIIISRLLISSNNHLSTSNSTTWLVPLLALLGIGVASYLAYVEVTHVEAVCGPVGECNIVQSSSYAQLFGITIAIWGLLNYLAILVLWAGQQFLSGKFASWCLFGLVLLTVFGTLFSIYLTSLELFAIKAICLWCLSSAVITTLIMILVTKDISEKSLQVNLATQTNA
jgi:uncharacterized membrane protein/thiol-disulfide isomerase/thioredoxin